MKSRPSEDAMRIWALMHPDGARGGEDVRRPMTDAGRQREELDLEEHKKVVEGYLAKGYGLDGMPITDPAGRTAPQALKSELDKLRAEYNALRLDYENIRQENAALRRETDKLRIMLRAMAEAALGEDYIEKLEEYKCRTKSH